MKGLTRWAALFWICCSFESNTKADGLAISPITPLEAPAFTQHGGFPFNGAAVGVSGTNVIYMWNQVSGNLPDQIDMARFKTNLFFTRLDQSAQPIDVPGRFVVSRFFTSGHSVTLLPADSGFFMVYTRLTNVTYPLATELLVTRFDLSGTLSFEPKPITTNAVKTFRAASNGRTMMFVYDGRAPETNAIVFTVIDGHGNFVARGAVDGSLSPLTYALASDGTDYMLAWQARTQPYQRATRFNGSNGTYSTVGFGTNYLNVVAAGHGKNGYLVAANSLQGQGELWQLADDGSLIAKTTYVPAIGVESVIYGEDEGWVIFSRNLTGGIVSMRVTPSQAGLDLELSPYPTISSYVYAPGTTLQSAIVPFGQRQYLISENKGYSLLTKAGQSAPLQQWMHKNQRYSKVVASPFGYLVVWQESDDMGYSIRAMRLAKDGTHLGAITVWADSTNSDLPGCIFDGEDYIVWTGRVSNAALTRVARISPFGEPDVRFQENVFPPVNGDFGFAVNAGNLYGWYWGGSTISPDLHFFPVSPSGARGAETIVNGEILLSDGPNLYAVGIDNSAIYSFLVEPGAGQTTERLILGVNNQPSAFSLKTGVVVAWGENTGSTFVYLTNGAPKLSLTSSLPGRPGLAQSDDRLLAYWLTNSPSHQYAFRTINLSTGETADTSVRIGTYASPHIDSAGDDFFAVTDSIGFDMAYIGGFWITTADSPSFGAAGVENLESGVNPGIKVSLTLDPDRRYRIELSKDLENWTLLEVVGGVSQHEMALSGSERTFVRAILVPE